MKKMKICLISSILFLSACSLEARVENENTEIDNMRATREQQREIEAFVDEKREEYLSELGELTFTGDPADLLGVRLSKRQLQGSRENPEEYFFFEIDGNVMLEIEYYLSMRFDNDLSTQTTTHEVIELEVLDIRFENETYIIETITTETDESETDESEVHEMEPNELTFELEQVENSLIRLRDGRGDILVPEYHVPVDLLSEWYEEAYTELGINPDELSED